MVTRRDWWIGVGVVALGLLVHASVPRYEWQASGTVRIDRWTGGAEIGVFRDNNLSARRRWKPIPEAPETDPLPPSGQRIILPHLMPQPPTTGQPPTTDQEPYRLPRPWDLPPTTGQPPTTDQSPLGLIAGGVFVVVLVGGLGFLAGKRRAGL